MPKHPQTTTPLLCTGTCAGQQNECFAEDPVELVSTFLKRNLLVWLIIPPAVDTVEGVVVTALNIDHMSTTILSLVAQNVGEVRLVTPDVIQEIFLLNPLHRQLDGPVFPVRILEQIFFPVKVTIDSLASPVLLNDNNYMHEI